MWNWRASWEVLAASKSRVGSSRDAHAQHFLSARPSLLFTATHYDAGLMRGVYVVSEDACL